MDLTRELGALLTYSSKVAVAIRMYSAYSDCNPRPDEPPLESSEAAQDLMWLADSLHNFDLLGQALELQDEAAIVDACDSLLYAYKEYEQARPAAHLKGDPARAFARNAHHFTLGEGVQVLHAIRAKAAAVATAG